MDVKELLRQVVFVRVRETERVFLWLRGERSLSFVVELLSLCERDKTYLVRGGNK